MLNLSLVIIIGGAVWLVISIIFVIRATISEGREESQILEEAVSQEPAPPAPLKERRFKEVLRRDESVATDLRTKLEAVAKENITLRQKIDERRTLMDGFKEELQQIKSQVASALMKDESQKDKSTVDDLQAKLESITKENSNLQEQLKHVVNEIDSQKTNLQSALDKRYNKIDGFEKELQQIRTQLVPTSKKGEPQKDKLIMDDLQAKLESITKENSNLQEQLKQITSDIDSQKNNLQLILDDKKYDKIDGFEKELQQLKMSLASGLQKGKGLRQARFVLPDDLRAKLETITMENNALSQQLELLAKEIDDQNNNFQKSLDKRYIKIENLENELRKVKARLTGLAYKSEEEKKWEGEVAEAGLELLELRSDIFKEEKLTRDIRKEIDHIRETP